ncbi:hypothetical protein E2562_019294 [Oryza meyeriana var. granulata]|uniref:C3H1-type domain-containing protein n=1 Tax=Oryza meyeriana var. granulata TaxID=110450 RepID=A0A6G1FAB9_9ORYZ|nr:hypothetical protein E2562_019294 [Oryza meyeriana var. granulata]
MSSAAGTSDTGSGPGSPGMPAHTPVTAATPATAVDLPPGHRPIGLKWVFKLKRDEQGAIVKHKARIVAKGYIQQQGIDYDEVFAPVAQMESVRMLLAVAAQRGWLVHHMDVKSAFLNGELKKEVYVWQPPGFVAGGHKGKVLRLKKALYGLRQVPRAWNTKLDNNLRELGFTSELPEATTKRTNHGVGAGGDVWPNPNSGGGGGRVSGGLNKWGRGPGGADSGLRHKVPYRPCRYFLAGDCSYGKP